ncbi:MAG: type I phosphomannose isomerase catalytic subunit [Candidatus Hydrogenedentota bacterium]
MTVRMPALLRFREGYFERIWGGDKLRRVFGKPAPANKPIGEAWVISDHARFQSAVVGGPRKGTTLRELLEEDARALLGRRPELTVHGRFPLLLKLLDAADVLSVQVHPDDAAAKRLGEPDVGKTEMWHVLAADPHSKLYCGLRPGVNREMFAAAIEANRLEELIVAFDAAAGDSVFVPAGTVHAIGGGLVIAEIQQNSDITYRSYDWGRTGAQGHPRELHIEKSLEVTHFGSAHTGANTPLAYDAAGARVQVLGACRHFAAEEVTVQNRFSRRTRGDSFHIVLAKSGPVTVRAAEAPADSCRLEAGEAVLLPGCHPGYTIEGPGAVLAYYVPDLARDIVAPLRAAGHDDASIVRLGGAPEESDLAAWV